MLSLQDLQKQFINALYDPEKESLIHSEIFTGPVDARKQIQIYRNNIFHNLTESLVSTFSKTCTIVDKRFFRYAAREYILNTPSTSGNLDDYGANFPEFLRSFSAVSHLHYLPDIAQLEWLCHCSYRADSAPPIDPKLFNNIDPHEYFLLTFTLHPSCQLFHSPYPINQIWDLCKQGEEHNCVKLEDQETYILVHRPESDILLIPLTKEEYYFLLELYNGNTLYDAYNVAENLMNNFDLSASIQRFIALDIFCGCNLEKPNSNINGETKECFANA